MSTLPRPISANPQGDWLHDVATSRAIEAPAVAAAGPQVLMQRAGTAVARLTAALAPHARRITVIAGPGNNGGDGLVAATWLHLAGRAVQVQLCADPARLTGDARWAFGQAQAAGVPINGLAETNDADWVIDALFGLGTRPIEGTHAEAVRRINAGAAPVLAVDLPSGLNADTGEARGAVVRAAHTLSLLTLKPGLFTAHGRDHAGRVWFDHLGVTADPSRACARLSPIFDRSRHAQRPHASHKGSYGDLVVVGGDRGMAGAAWLAAQAALAAGAGRVYASLLDDQADPLLPTHPELMSRRAAWQEPVEWLRTLTVVCGCGGGAAVGSALPPLLAHAPRLVLDADALNAVAHDPSLQEPLRRRASRGLATVLTPHPLEAARLLALSSAEVQAARLTAARALAERFGAVVVLKGSGSIVAPPGGTPSINLSGNAALATAGTGDVLAGWLGGWWCSNPHEHAFDAALRAVWLHGHAADLHRERGHAGPLSGSALIGAMQDLC